jgi:hypothetical protein
MQRSRSFPLGIVLSAAAFVASCANSESIDIDGITSHRPANTGTGGSGNDPTGVAGSSGPGSGGSSGGTDPTGLGGSGSKQSSGAAGTGTSGQAGSGAAGTSGAAGDAGRARIHISEPTRRVVISFAGLWV